MQPDADAPRWVVAWRLIGGVLLLALLALALSPLPPVLGPELLSDKFWHTLAFCMLMLWFASLYPRRRALLLFVLLLSYGVLMEVLQSQVPNRYAEIGDLYADTLGLLVGWGLALTPLRRWPFWLERWLRFGRFKA